VQNDSGGIDDWTERVAQILTELACDGGGQPGQGKSDTGVIECAFADSCAQAGENGAGCIGDRGLSFLGGQRDQLGGAQEIIYRRKLAVKIGPGMGGHRDDYGMRREQQEARPQPDSALRVCWLARDYGVSLNTVP